MKKAKGLISLEIKCDCPYCKELQYTDNPSFRKEITEFNEISTHHESVDEMNDMLVACTDCGKEFIIEKVVLIISNTKKNIYRHEKK